MALARTPLGGLLTRRRFGALCRWLPVPKTAIAGIATLPGDETALYADLVAAVQRLARESALAPRGYRLIVNGSAHRDVPTLHLYLVSEGAWQPEAIRRAAQGGLE